MTRPSGGFFVFGELPLVADLRSFKISILIVSNFRFAPESGP